MDVQGCVQVREEEKAAGTRLSLPVAVFLADSGHRRVMSRLGEVVLVLD
jgi:ribosomal protein L14